MVCQSLFLVCSNDQLIHWKSISFKDALCFEIIGMILSELGQETKSEYLQVECNGQ